MTALKEMTVYKHNVCDNPVAYQNIPVFQSGVDRSDGRQWEPFSYTRTDIHQAALDRIAELEGALKEISEKDWAWGRAWVAEEYGVRMSGQYAKIARAVLAKGDG